MCAFGGRFRFSSRLFWLATAGLLAALAAALAAAFAAIFCRNGDGDGEKVTFLGCFDEVSSWLDAIAVLWLATVMSGDACNCVSFSGVDGVISDLDTALLFAALIAALDAAFAAIFCKLDDGF